MLLDEVMPEYDTVITVHRVVAAEPAVVLRAARALDLLSVRTPLLDVSMWLRGLPARLTGRAVPVPPRLVLADGGLPGWSVLAESGDEFVFGAVGRFWQPVIRWRDVDPVDFPAFAEPGWGKIAANFSVRTYGRGTLLSYECRTRTTDTLSRKQFRRYWGLVRPFVAHILTATTATIDADTQRLARAGGGGAVQRRQ
jgi:hypothetical protein